MRRQSEGRDAVKCRSEEDQTEFAGFVWIVLSISV